MTTHHSFGRVFSRLKMAPPTWDLVEKAPAMVLQDLIKDAGLSNQKVPRIFQILRRLVADF